MMTKPISKLLAGLALFAATISANASLVSFTLEGLVTYDDTGNGTNIFGLPVGDTSVVATGTFNDSLIGGNIVSGSGTIFVSAIPDLMITVGTQTFTAADDNGSGQLNIINGTVIDGNDPAGFVYAGTNGNGNDFTSDASENFIGNSSIFGNWTTFNLTPVPIPAAVWLFGSGLIGLVGIARRKAV